jgi:hypothetical protein
MVWVARASGRAASDWRAGGEFGGWILMRVWMFVFFGREGRARGNRVYEDAGQWLRLIGLQGGTPGLLPAGAFTGVIVVGSNDGLL